MLFDNIISFAKLAVLDNIFTSFEDVSRTTGINKNLSVIFFYRLIKNK